MISESWISSRGPQLSEWKLTTIEKNPQGQLWDAAHIYMPILTQTYSLQVC